MKQNGNWLSSTLRSNTDIQAYFKKLGLDFKKLPFLKLKFADYENLFIREDGLFQRSHLQKEDGIDALIVALPTKKEDPIRITFAIEDPSKMQSLIQALHKNVQTSKEKTFLKALERLQVHCAKLHLQWRENQKR
ncbi:MAG: hypothetical protein ACOY3I_10570 [Verrucomicrobiota bacterium]